MDIKGVSYYRHMTKNPQMLISSREVAELLNVDTRTVQRRADNGEIPFVSKMPGLRGAYIFNKPDILALAPAETSPEVVSAGVTGGAA